MATPPIDYAFIDCNLFRTPPVDLSGVTYLIEKSLLTAWQSGHSAAGALEDVLSNQEVIGPLAAKISHNLRYQAETALQQVGEQSRSRIAAYEKEKEGRLDEIKASIGAEADAKERQLLQASHGHEQAQSQYSAAQANLDRIRKRIQAQLRDVGGKSGYDTIMRINEAVVGTGTVGTGVARLPSHERMDEIRSRYRERRETAAHSGDSGGKESGSGTDMPEAYMPEVYMPEVAGEIQGAEADGSQESLDELLSKIDAQQNRGLRRVWEKVWNILNYKLW